MSRKFTSWLSEKLTEKSWSMRELGRRAGVSNTTVSRVVSGELNPTWDFCAAISGPLGEPIWSIAKLAGLLPAGSINDEEITFQELLDIMKGMPVEQRREVLRYAKYLVQRGDEN